MKLRKFGLLVGWFVGLLVGCGGQVDQSETVPTSTLRVEEVIAVPLPVVTRQVTSNATATSDPTPIIEPTATPEWIELPIAVYILDDAGGVYSSERDVGEMPAIYERVNEIWSQAHIRLVVQGVERVEMPASHMQSISLAQFDPFFNGVGRDFDIPNPALINAFYVKQVGRANGINPFGARLFFVMDTPSVHDERVTSHEIGHILGLQHDLDDRNMLMYSGTNGMGLSEVEVVVARYNAGKLLEGYR